MPAPKPPDPDRSLAFISAWNDETLSNDELTRQLGLGWCRLRQAATKLRRQGHTLIERRKVYERMMAAPHQPPDPALPTPGRSVGAAVDILLRQKRDLRFRGDLIYLDGRIITLPELFDIAYGPPPGKWR